jgi:hypothetical protein
VAQCDVLLEGSLATTFQDRHRAASQSSSHPQLYTSQRLARQIETRGTEERIVLQQRRLR